MAIYAVVNKDYFIDEQACDIRLNNPLAYSEQYGHYFGLNLKNRDGSVADLTGISASGTFLRADGNTVGWGGTVNVNSGTVYIVLPPSCYAVEGRCKITLWLSSGSGSSATNRAVMVVRGFVEKMTSNSSVDPGTIIPSIQTLLTTIEEAVESIPADYSGLKGGMDEAVYNMIKTVGYTALPDLYINASSGKINTPSSSGLYLLVIPCKSGTKYKVWKNTVTMMRVASGKTATPTNNMSVTMLGALSPASNNRIVGYTGSEDTYLYIQLYTASDSSSYRSIEANIGSLIVVEDGVDYIENHIDELLETSDRIAEIDGEIDDVINVMGTNSVVDVSGLVPKQLYINTNNNQISTTSGSARMISVPAKGIKAFRIACDVESTKRIAFSDAVSSGTTVYRAEEFSGELDATVLNVGNHSYLLIQLFSNGDDETASDYLNAMTVTAIASGDSQISEILAINPATYMQSLPWVRGSYYNNAYVNNNSTKKRRCVVGPILAKKGFTIHADSGVRFWTGEWTLVEGVMTRSVYTASGTKDVRIPRDMLFDVSVAYVDEDGYTDTEELYNDLLAGIHFVFEGTAANPLPDYWEDALPDFEYAVVQKEIDSEAGDTFMFVTDTHWTSNQGYSSMLIRRISNDLNIKKVICGGDFINSHQTVKRAAIEELVNYFGSFDGMDVFATVGNHDTNRVNNGEHPEAYILDREAYNLVAKRNGVIGVTDPVSMCSYMENAAEKVRYIQFPYWAATNYNTTYVNTVLGKVKAWYDELDDDWTVVLVSHMYWTGSDQQGQAVVPDQSGYIAEYFASMAAGSGKATIAMWLVGHCHRDLSVVYTGQSGIKILVVSSLCDSMRQNINSYNVYDPEVGTTTEQAFDVVRVDTEEKKLYFTRVGAGYDRTFVYDQESDSFGLVT